LLPIGDYIIASIISPPAFYQHRNSYQIRPLLWHDISPPPDRMLTLNNEIEILEQRGADGI
jgi:hypothetical protein